MADFELTDEQKKQAEVAREKRFKRPEIKDVMLFTTGGVTADDLGGDTTGLQLNHIRAVEGVEVKLDGYAPQKAFSRERPAKAGKPVYGDGGYKFKKLTRKAFDELSERVAKGELKPAVGGTPGSFFAVDEVEKVEAKFKEQRTAAQRG